MFEIENSIRLSLNIMILTQIGDFSRQQWSIFPQKGNFQWFTYPKLENIIQMFQTLFKCLN